MVTAEKDGAALVSVGIDSLITGRTISLPIFDHDGVLLLAEGSVITTKFKQQLRARGIGEIELDTRDAEAVTLTTAGDLGPQAVQLDSELTEKLDRIIDSGNLFVANTGPAFAEQMVFQGCKAYDQESRRRIVEVHANASKSLDGFIQNALHGEDISGQQLLNTAGSYLTAMMSDADCVLDTVLQVGQDVELSEHCIRLALAGMAIGIEMQLDEDNLRTLGLCGLVHDWGMVKVSEEIRCAPRWVSEAEFVAIKRHPIHSLEMLEQVKGLPREVPLVAYQVHERADGSGYPRCRKQAETHDFARILGVADAYVALSSPRPYRKALMPYAAMECIITQASQGVFDTNVVKAMLQAMGLFPISSYVVLDDASVARVLRRSGAAYAKPIVQRISNADGSEISEDDSQAIVDLSQSDEFRVTQALPMPGQDEIRLTPEILSPPRSEP